MAKRRVHERVAAPGKDSHPAAASTGLALAVGLGIGTTLLLLTAGEGKMRRIARKIVPPRPGMMLRNHLEPSPRKPSPARMVAGAVLTSAGIAGTFVLLDSIFNRHAPERFDHHLHNVFRMHRSAAQRKAVKSTTIIGSPTFVLPLDLAVVVGLLRRDKVREAVALTWTAVASSILSEAVKNIVQRSRPPEGRLDKDEYSFPSGHTMLAASSYALIAYILAEDDRLGGWRLPAAAALTALIPWTAFSRMYLGMHWPSDTIAGMALGLAWDAAIVTFLRVT